MTHAYGTYANYLFASCFAPNQWMMAKRLRRENGDRLVAEGGCAIIYTHFGYYHQEGGLDAGFVRAIEEIGRRDDLWFAPVSTILDYLIASGQGGDTIPIFRKKRVEAHSLWTRLKYRYVEWIDDFHYKKKVGA